MHRLILICFLQILAFEVISQQTEVDSIYVDTLWRKFIVFTPQAYSTDTNSLFPVIINLHGYTSDALQQMLYTNMNPFADTAGFVVVYPYGTTDTMGNRYWNAGFSPIGADDVSFLDSLVKYLVATKRIDQNGIFFCGLSNGGIMSYYMACFSQTPIRGIASVAGTPLTSWFPCSANPLPVIHFHGTADGTVPYNGGFIPPLQDSFMAVNKLIDFWKETNYCVDTPDSLFIDKDLTDSTQVIYFKWRHKSKDYYPLELFKILNGGHTWPGADFIYDVTTQDIHASSEIIRFFKYIYTANIYVTSNSVPQISQNSVQSVMRLQANVFVALLPVNIFSIEGKIIGSFSKGDIFLLPTGIYVVYPKISSTPSTILFSY